MHIQRNLELEKAVFDLHQSPDDFNRVMLSVFQFQFLTNRVYQEFCILQNMTQPKNIEEIPFLPISFFKTHRICCGDEKEELLFMSSGTTGQVRSKHLILYPEVYKESFIRTYRKFIGNPETQTIVALLPNYLEQGNSSLVYMVRGLIQMSENKASGFLLNDLQKVVELVELELSKGNEVVLFGVAYALLDLANLRPNFSGVKVIETGGMKGRRKELTKEELHEQLKNGLNINQVLSEYGMTELLSQAYSLSDQWFTPPNWMRVMIREVDDPKSYLPDLRAGGINVIDLANIYSCSFIATDDLGLKTKNTFKVIGRIDNSDIRGCNLLVG